MDCEYVTLNAPVSQIKGQAVDLRQDLSRVKVHYSNPSQLQVRPDKQAGTAKARCYRLRAFPPR